MAVSRPRPLSPHLSIWRWRVHMLVSILHRATGTALATAGAVLLVWWLAAAAGGAGGYDRFIACVTNDDGHLAWYTAVVLIGLTWSFFQHMFSGLRHFVLDTGAGYELKTNRLWATMTIVGSVLATLALWAFILDRGV